MKYKMEWIFPSENVVDYKRSILNYKQLYQKEMHFVLLSKQMVMSNIILRQTPPGATVATCDLILIGLSAVTWRRQTRKR